MPRKGDKRPEHIEGNPNDPQGMAVLAKAYLEALAVKAFSTHTIQLRRTHLNRFIHWAAERDVTRPNEVTRPMAERYQKFLFYYRNAQDRPLGFRAQHNHLVSIRGWMKWLAKHNHILYNPAAELELPRIGQHLPKQVLSPNEAEAVLNQTDVRQRLGVRDRAIMEVLYSTGMRRMELGNLQVYDLDTNKRTVLIRQGKGKKDRMLPIGERAVAWTVHYLQHVRPELMTVVHHTTLFITRDGLPFSTQRLSDLVRRYVRKAELSKTGGCHLFRHSMATSMLENGADIRYIQAMLGHASLESTEIYTQVSIRKLQQIHDATHPASNQKEKEKPDADEKDAQASVNESEPTDNDPPANNET